MNKLIYIFKKLLRRFRRLISFGIVGVINTLVDYGVFTLAYKAAALSAGLSQALGYICGSVCGYILNSSVTFREGRGRTKGQFLQYLAVDAAFIALTAAVMAWAEKAGLNAYITKIVLTVVVMLLHYVIFKHIVFRIKKEDSQND